VRQFTGVRHSSDLDRGAPPGRPQAVALGAEAWQPLSLADRSAALLVLVADFVTTRSPRLPAHDDGAAAGRRTSHRGPSIFKEILCICCRRYIE
jgi:hypothetical protein